MSGKGDKWRKDFDFKKFWTNFDSISSEQIDKPKYKKVKKIKINKTRYTY